MFIVLSKIGVSEVSVPHHPTSLSVHSTFRQPVIQCFCSRPGWLLRPQEVNISVQLVIYLLIQQILSEEDEVFFPSPRGIKDALIQKKPADLLQQRVKPATTSTKSLPPFDVEVMEARFGLG